MYITHVLLIHIYMLEKTILHHIELTDELIWNKCAKRWTDEQGQVVNPQTPQGKLITKLHPLSEYLNWECIHDTKGFIAAR